MSALLDSDSSPVAAPPGGAQVEAGEEAAEPGGVQVEAAEEAAGPAKDHFPGSATRFQHCKHKYMLAQVRLSGNVQERQLSQLVGHPHWKLSMSHIFYATFSIVPQDPLPSRSKLETSSWLMTRYDMMEPRSSCLSFSHDGTPDWSGSPGGCFAVVDYEDGKPKKARHLLTGIERHLPPLAKGKWRLEKNWSERSAVLRSQDLAVEMTVNLFQVFWPEGRGDMPWLTEDEDRAKKSPLDWLSGAWQ
jgi:hypothetical protein